jgi:hypothetical protein
MTIDSSLNGLIEQGRTDLAQRLGVSVDEIAIKEVKAVEWKDASLGCPTRGVNYVQVVTPGYRIVLEAKGQTYDYRTDGRRIFLCERS